MNKSKRLRLERQALKSKRLMIEAEIQQQRIKLLENIKRIGQEVDEELKQEVVV